MKVFRDLSEFDIQEGLVVTTGTFDGVHLGHQKVLKSLVDSAKINGLQSLILTFHPHPRIVLQQNTDLKLLSTIDEKIDLLAKQGIDNLLILPFTKAFSRTTSLEFVREILVNTLGTQKLILGYDHHFGRNREGSFEHLLEFGPLYGFEVKEIPAKDVDEVNVSSTKIREALELGDVKRAERLLGHRYALRGEVVKGRQIGSVLGFPTANISVDNPYKLIPLEGVYAVTVNFGSRDFSGMLNIGYRPTFEGEKELSIEVNVFDFNQDLYGQEIEIFFVDRIRKEVTFENTDELIRQLKIDEVNCRKALSV